MFSSSIIPHTIHTDYVHAHSQKPSKSLLYTLYTTRTKCRLLNVYWRDLLYFSCRQFKRLLCCLGRFLPLSHNVHFVIFLAWDRNNNHTKALVSLLRHDLKIFLWYDTLDKTSYGHFYFIQKKLL